MNIESINMGTADPGLTVSKALGEASSVAKDHPDIPVIFVHNATEYRVVYRANMLPTTVVTRRSQVHDHLFFVRVAAGKQLRTFEEQMKRAGNPVHMCDFMPITDKRRLAEIAQQVGFDV